MIPPFFEMVIETAENQTTFADMVQTIAGGEMLSFVGAGAVIVLGYPTWHQLIDILARETRTRFGEKFSVNSETLSVAAVQQMDDPLVADIFKSALGPRYPELMRTEFQYRGPRPRSVSRLLVVIH